MSVKPAVKHELHACQQQVSLLLDSQREQRSIGMDSETLQPDALLAFFTERNLPFAYYVRSCSGIAIGEASAYEKNIATLNMYMAHLRATEKAQIDNTIATLNEYKTRNQAIGLSADTLRPDRFMSFFAVRELPFAMYVPQGERALGDPSAYERNIRVLEHSLATLQA